MSNHFPRSGRTDVYAPYYITTSVTSAYPPNGFQVVGHWNLEASKDSGNLLT